MRVLPRLAIGLCALIVALPASAMTLEEARAAFKQGDYAAAVEVLAPLAEAGDPDAQNMMAVAHWDGHGVDSDPVRALELLEASAAQGFPRAHYNLGIFWRDGVGDYGVDNDKAIAYLKQAIALDYTGARASLAEMYIDKVNPPDYAKARELLEQDMADGDEHAPSLLGDMYVWGQGVEVNYDKARELFELAQERGERGGAAGLALMAARGQGGPIDLDTAMTHVTEFIAFTVETGDPYDHARIARLIYDQDLSAHDGPFSIRVLEEGVAAGETEAMIALGLAYLHGERVEENVEQARALFRQAGDAGNSAGLMELSYTYDDKNPDEAMIAVPIIEEAVAMGSRYGLISLAYMHYHGYGVERDLVRGYELNRQALDIESDDPRSDFYVHYNLGLDYLNGTGTEANPAKAHEFFQKAYDTLEVGAESYLGDTYRDGLGVEQDIARAIAYYEEGVQWGDARSAYALGRAYEMGEGVEQSLATAHTLYLRAYEEEEWEAAQALARAAYEWPRGDWTDAQEAFRYCLFSLKWEIEPFLNRTEANTCSKYAKDLSAYRQGVIRQEVASAE